MLKVHRQSAPQRPALAPRRSRSMQGSPLGDDVDYQHFATWKGARLPKS